MNCKVCSEPIPAVRIQCIPGVDTCVKCSEESKYSAIPIIHHKTGNTIEIIKDPEVAKEFRKVSTRAGFGTMRGMTSGASTTTKPKATSIRIGSTAFSGYQEQFEQVGKSAWDAFDLYGISKATKIINEAAESRQINFEQGQKILKLIQAAVTPAVEESKPKSLNKYNPYGKFEPKKESKTVSMEIEHAFRNWKK